MKSSSESAAQVVTSSADPVDQNKTSSVQPCQQKNAVGDDEDDDVDIIAIEDNESEVKADSSNDKGAGEDLDKTLTEESTNAATKEEDAVPDNTKTRNSLTMVDKPDIDKMVEGDCVAAGGIDVSSSQKDENETQKPADDRSTEAETTTVEGEKNDAESTKAGEASKEGQQAQEPGESDEAKDGASGVTKRLVYTFNAPTTTLHTTTTTTVNTVQFIGLSLPSVCGRASSVGGYKSYWWVCIVSLY